MKRFSTSLGKSPKQLKPNNHGLKTSPIAIFNTGVPKSLCSALNHYRNLILIYGRKVRATNQRGYWVNVIEFVITIYTIEGYHVTTKTITEGTSFKKASARFTDHMIMICDETFRLKILTDFSPKFPTSQRRISFVEFDEKGDIYTNGEEKNEIAVYSQSLEFKRKFEVDLPNYSKIVSFHIRDETMIIQTYNNSSDSSVYTIHRFVPSSMKLVDCLDLDHYGQQMLNSICIDQFRNIIISTYKGIRIWPYKSALIRPIWFEKGKTPEYILLTEDSQIILVNYRGTIRVHQLDMTSIEYGLNHI